MAEPIKILYVDNPILNRRLVQNTLEKEPDVFKVTEAESRQKFGRLLTGD